MPENNEKIEVTEDSTKFAVTENLEGQQKANTEATNSNDLGVLVYENPIRNIVKHNNLSFYFVHLACLGIIFTGFSVIAFLTAVFLHYLRAFALTAGYHRYFAHRSYKTSRWFQFVLGWLGCSAAQMGPLWWAGHHRHHHIHSDTEEDIHSPGLRGFYWSHCGWVISNKYSKTNEKIIKDYYKFPELVWLNNMHWIPVAALAILAFGFGWFLQVTFPGTWLGNTGPWQMLVAFFISTVTLYHSTFFVNSLAHVMGSRRFMTKDDSRNNLLISLLTMGEGWHNNHHRYPASERQGFYWYEIDPSHYVLKFLSFFGIVWGLQEPPQKVYDEAKKNSDEGTDLTFSFEPPKVEQQEEKDEEEKAA